VFPGGLQMYICCLGLWFVRFVFVCMLLWFEFLFAWVVGHGI